MPIALLAMRAYFCCSPTFQSVRPGTSTAQPGWSAVLKVGLTLPVGNLPHSLLINRNSENIQETMQSVAKVVQPTMLSPTVDVTRVSEYQRYPGGKNDDVGLCSALDDSEIGTHISDLHVGNFSHCFPTNLKS